MIIMTTGLRRCLVVHVSYAPVVGISIVGTRYGWRDAIFRQVMVDGKSSMPPHRKRALVQCIHQLEVNNDRMK